MTNPLNFVAPSTKGLIADIVGGTEPERAASLVASLLDVLNPLLMLLVNKHEGKAKDILFADLRQYVREALGEGNGANGVFDRPMHFTLFCPDTASLTLAISRVCQNVANVVVDDDRDGSSGSWLVKFTANGVDVVSELRELGNTIDVQMAIVKET